jgi:hypothetical protein
MRGGSEASNHVMKAMNNCNYTLHGGGMWCMDSIRKHIKTELTKIDEVCLKKKEKVKSKSTKRRQKGGDNTCAANANNSLISDTLTYDIVNNLGKNEYNGNFNMIDGVHRFDGTPMSDTHGNITVGGNKSSFFPAMLGGGGCGCGEAINH